MIYLEKGVKAFQWPIHFSYVLSSEQWFLYKKLIPQWKRQQKDGCQESDLLPKGQGTLKMICGFLRNHALRPMVFFGVVSFFSKFKEHGSIDLGSSWI